jgi:hypothetical protein
MMISEVWFDGYRYCCQYQDAVFQAATAEKAFQMAYAAMCQVHGV